MKIYFVTKCISCNQMFIAMRILLEHPQKPIVTAKWFDKFTLSIGGFEDTCKSPPRTKLTRSINIVNSNCDYGFATHSPMCIVGWLLIVFSMIGIDRVRARVLVDNFSFSGIWMASVSCARCMTQFHCAVARWNERARAQNFFDFSLKNNANIPWHIVIM